MSGISDLCDVTDRTEVHRYYQDGDEKTQLFGPTSYELTELRL